MYTRFARIHSTNPLEIKLFIIQLYCVGGDGTHYGMMKICEEAEKRKMKLAIAGLPKTIDNDIPIIINHIQNSGGVIERIYTQGTNLESIYLKLTGKELRD